MEDVKVEENAAFLMDKRIVFMLQLLELIEEFGKHKITTQRFSSLLIKRRAHAPSKPSSIYIYIYIYNSHAKLYRRKHATTYRIIIPTAPNLPSSSPTGCPMIPTIVMASVVTVVLLDIRIQYIIPKSSNASIGRCVRHGYNWYSSKYGPTFQT